MRWLQKEYILKGIFLGLLLFVALHEPDWLALGEVALLTVAGLSLSLGIAAAKKIREGYRVKGRIFPFLLFLVLESPDLVYLGTILGMVVSAFLRRGPDGDRSLLIACLADGAVLGIVFGLLRHVHSRWTRIGLSLALAVLLVAGVLALFGKLGDLGIDLSLANPVNPTIFGTQILLGLPFFYVLTLAGRQEESEIEIGAMCAALGLAGAMLTVDRSGMQSVALIVPVMLYFWYTTNVLPRLRVFKHSMRGFSYAEIGQHRLAILSFRRALSFDAQNALAREGLWRVHRGLDLGQLANDPQTLALVDFELCLDRAGTLLLQPSPSPAKLQEAYRLLDMVMSHRPTMGAAVHYWKAVALTHEHRYDEAAAELAMVLDPAGYDPADPHRKPVLLSAWQLALRWRPELAERVGRRQLAQPGRRMEAIAAAERQLVENADDQEVWGFKRMLYQDLTEAEYKHAAGGEGPAKDFDYSYAQQLGLALIGDSERWQRGAEYLRMAAHGLPALGPSIFTQIAQAHQREGHGQDAWHNYELAKRAGQAMGPKNLAEEDRQAYFTAVKLMGDAALAHDQIPLAIENYQLYTESDRSGLETLRTLAGLFERAGDPWSALRVTEKALLYNAKDKDLLERKDRYYYSVMPDDLKSRLETVRGMFDAAYCLKKARALVDAKNWDFDTLEWAQHLAELARVVYPDSLLAKLIIARIRIRRGEKDEGLALLEQIRVPKPETFASADDEDAWFQACRMLGEIYLFEKNQPDLAVQCFQEFRKSAKSGGDTLYKLGQAYEQMGDSVRAVKFYKHVVAYDNHPLAPDAYDALHRLEANHST